MHQADSINSSFDVRVTSGQLATQFFWLGLCVLAGLAAWQMGVPQRMAIQSASMAALPAVVGVLGVSVFGLRLGGPLLVFSWTALAVAGVAATGGAISPLSALFALAPMTALSLGRRRLAVEAAVFGAIGYLAASIASALGWTPNEVSALGPTAGLGALIAILQIGALAGSIAVKTRRDRALVREADLVRHVWNDAPVVLLDVSRNGRIRAVAGDTLQILGAQRSELIGLELQELSRPDEQAALRDLSDGQAPLVFSPIWNSGRRTEVTASPARNGHRLVLRDASQVEASLEHLAQERDQADAEGRGVATFFASLGHELRTPLNAILGFADMIRHEAFGDLNPRYREQAEMIHEGGQHLQLLVDDLLDAAKTNAGKLTIDPHPLELRPTAVSALALMRAQADRANVTLHLADGPDIAAEADERAVRQIWLNLLSNAIKFTPEGGSVVVRIEAAKDKARLCVQDTGVGLSPAELERLGKPFEQGQNAKGKVGSGLGLAVVKAFVDLHGGEFEIDSALGEGTTVYVTLPFAIDADEVGT